MAVTNKIMLKETTKMSLHERFTVYRKQSQLQQQLQKQQQQQLGALSGELATHSLQQQRLQQQRVQRQASIKNQRLALQMANRPSVQAALKLKKRSLRQRLGQGTDGINPIRAGNIKSRLSLQPFALRNRLGGFQGGLGRSPSARGGRTIGIRNGRFNRGGLRASGTSPMLKGRLGTGNTGNRMRTPLGQNKRTPFKRGRGGNQRGFGKASFARGGFRQQGQVRMQNNRGRGQGGRGGRNNNRGGRGFRRGNWNQQQQGKTTNNNNNSRPGSARGRRGVPSKQDLDNDLDEYMAKTKSHLDAELDAYMAQAE